MAKKQTGDDAPQTDVTFGVVGTDIFDGQINNDYQKNWRNLTKRLEVIDEMKKGDASISAILDTVKAPLLSAKWYIEPAGSTPEQKEHALFIERALFVELQGGWDEHLIEALSCLDYGFSLFEKVYGVSSDGKIIVKRLAPRLQSTIDKWGVDGQTWVDGHPTGVTQLVYGSDEVADKGIVKTVIPWNKLLRFSFRASGNNFEGQSLLRPAYKHWYFKELLYKISTMAAERFGVGVPYIHWKKDPNPTQKRNADDMLSNIRSNEKAYAQIGENVQTFDILIPKSSGNLSIIHEAIRDHDQKIYDSILAGFLKLASGDGGSFALSRDQSSFFLRSEQWIANFICNVYNGLISELIYLNYGVQDAYPKLKTSDVGQVSLDEYIKALAIARKGGLISWSDSDETKVREQLKLPGLSKVEETSSPRLDPSSDPALDPQFSEKRPTRALADETAPSRREMKFMKNIADYENFLNGQYKRAEKMIADIEDQLREGLKEIYEKADTERLDGRLVFARTPNNSALQRRAIDLLKAKTKKVNRLIFKNANNKDCAFMRTLFEKTRSMALASLDEDESFFADIFIDEKKFDAFMKGYRSNVDALLFNDPRRVEENIIQNFGSQVAVDLAVSQTDGPIFNRNVLTLSLLTHPRGAYNAIQFDINNARGFTMYKVLAPKNVISNLDPAGMTAKLLFGIYTVAQLNKKVSEMTDGKTAESVNGLGFHHNAITYFFPIPSDQLDEEQRISRAQRSQLKDDLS